MLIDKIRETIKKLNANVNDYKSIVLDKDYFLEMAQALIAVDDVLKPPLLTIEGGEFDQAFVNGYAQALDEIRKAIESTEE